MPKHTLRLHLMQERKALAPAAREEFDRLIQKRFLESPLFAAAQRLALYAPVQGEVDTSVVFEVARDAGKTVFFPVVQGNSLVFRSVSTILQLKRGTFGVLEPDDTCPAVDPCVADVVVVPGVGFDPAGTRIGYGKGYYDRSFHALEGSGRLAAFSYELQVVDSIAGEPHDVAVDWIFTETRTIRVSRT